MRRMKVLVVATGMCLFLAAVTYAASPLVEIRSRFARESGDLKALMATSKDAYLVSSMWDSCLLTMNQIDAYFSMVGIVNTINKDQTTRGAIVYLEQWLSEIKRISDLNIKSLSGSRSTIDPVTKVHVDVLTRHFGDLSKLLSAEASRLASYKQTLKK